MRLRIREQFSILHVLPLTLLLALASGCGSESGENDNAAAGHALEKAPELAVNEAGIIDSKAVYADDAPDSVVTLYVTVRRGTRADDTYHSLAEVNSVVRTQGMGYVPIIKAEALVQEGDEKGPLPGMLGYGRDSVNATIRIRGRTSTAAGQKSYRLDLYDNAGTWRGQSAIALNKHASEVTRLRNKLYFDLLKQIDDIPSLRTQFVHLYVKDETALPAEEVFSDYGLFTQVELPNKRYLRNHGFDKAGNLYKANMCEMFRYPDKLKLASDPDYDINVFSEVLEPKTSEDHAKLLEMLDALNDYSIPVTDVIAKYFDIDNVLTFMAYNLLMDNNDCDAQNYLLYSPASSSVWYYLPWDGDSSLTHTEKALLSGNWQESPWRRGVSNYWGNVLFNRLLRVKEYRDALTRKIEKLRVTVNANNIRKYISVYHPITKKYAFSMPDALHIGIREAQYDQMIEHMLTDCDGAYIDYYDSLTKPMPFFLGDAAAAEGGILLSWGESYDFSDKLVSYTVQISRDWTFEKAQLVFEQAGIAKLNTIAPMLPAGEYSWRAVSLNAEGKTHVAFDSYYTSSGVHNGMRRFRVNADGSVENVE